MSLKSDFLQLLRPYYIVNILLSLSYIILKRTPIICNYLFNSQTCEFEGKETEILFFLVIVIMMRSRKAGAVSMINYVSSSFIYTKIANVILWFNADFLMGIIYTIAFILGALLLPEPTYSGPNNVLYFKSLQGLEDELKTKNVWLITFYTVWNPACVNFAPIFAKLSTQYNLDNFKFGKIDIGRYPDAGKKYNVSDSSMSKQLPTVILFENGKEVARRPMADAKGKLIKFVFNEEGVKAAFGLNNLYESCKNQLKNVGSNKGHVKSD